MVTIYYHCVLFLLLFNGNSMPNGLFAFKLTENVFILRYNFSLSDSLSLLPNFPQGRSHFSLLSGPSLNPVYHILSYRSVKSVLLLQGAQWLSGRVRDSRPKGRGFEPHRRHCVVVLEQDTFILA